jgi:hypothetical protein
MDMVFQAAGATTLSTPSNELYAAMQTGACDAGITSSTSLISFRLEEVAKALTSGAGASYWFMLEPLMMSKSIFDGLPKKQQDIILAVGAELEAFGKKGAQDDDIEVAKVYEKAGAKVSALDAATVGKWRRFDPRFQSELNRRRSEIVDAAAERLRALLPKALDVLESELDGGKNRFAAALQIAKLIRLGESLPSIGPLDAEEIVDRALRLAERVTENGPPVSRHELELALDHGPSGDDWVEELEIGFLVLSPDRGDPCEERRRDERGGKDQSPEGQHQHPSSFSGSQTRGSWLAAPERNGAGWLIQDDVVRVSVSARVIRSRCVSFR